MEKRFQVPDGSSVCETASSAPELVARLALGPLASETRMNRWAKRSKKTLGLKGVAATLLIVTPAQNDVRVTRETSMPARVWMRMRSLVAVTTQVGLTAPPVLGGMDVLLRNSA